ncbi:MAG: hypothetical protein FD135_2353 [Comamonadaceae bacterium]|nr:MAG: hypothetical protein FD135_2353 [Comamonadaceae bacterium]
MTDVRLTRAYQRIAAVWNIILVYVLWLPLLYVLSIAIAVRNAVLDEDHQIRNTLTDERETFWQRWSR